MGRCERRGESAEAWRLESFNRVIRLTDPAMRLRKDRIVAGEQRWHAIGVANGALIVVVHAYREDRSNGEEIIRIISARAIDSRERRIYLEQAAD
jgi:uncharacterized DUF497 family protein